MVSPAWGAQKLQPAQEDDTIKLLPPGQESQSAAANPNNMEELGPLEEQIKRGQYQQAVPGLKDYLQKHPDSARAHYDLGYIYFRGHQIEGAIQQLSKSLALNVNNAQAHEVLGLVCTWVGRYDLAEIEFLQAARLEPNSAEIHYWLGRNYYTRQVYPPALKEFQTAIRLDPTFMKAYYNLGLVMESMGQGDEAVKDYQTAAQLAENQGLKSPWPYEYLAAHYARDEQAAETIKFAQKALLMDPRCDLAYYDLAKAYRFQGNWQQSAAAAEEAIAINPNTTPEYYYLLSMDLRKLGKTQESEAAFKQFLQIHKSQTAAMRTWQKANREPDEPHPNPHNDP